jgi:hypothetical protein
MGVRIPLPACWDSLTARHLTCNQTVQQLLGLVRAFVSPIIRREQRVIANFTAPPADRGSPWESPPPVLLNTWKHHAAVLRHRIQETATSGDLSSLAANLVVIGTELMDLYLGQLSPAVIGQEILDLLTADGTLAPDAYRASLQASGGYRLLDLSDTSRWVLRMGDEAGRYVHAHPGRYSPNTRRVRANVLKSAVMVLAHVGIPGGDPMSVPLVNDVRRQHLKLARIGKDLAGDQGLGAVIDILRTG